MDITIFRLFTAALLPVIIAVVFFQAERKSRFGKLSNRIKQLVIGVAFGIVAILATEFGIPANGAVVNVRSAAPLTAGLIFGWPAGLLAGFIGGIQRWFSDAGDYTRLACSIGTIISGFMGASVRRFMMDNKKATWFYGLAVGVTAEVLHMLMVFIFNANDVYRAFEVVQKCAVPMITFNGLSVMMAIIVLSALSNRKQTRTKQKPRIAQAFQRWLLVCVMVAFGITMLFNGHFQNVLARAHTERLLQQNIKDVETDINEAADAAMLLLTHRIADLLPERYDTIFLRTLAQQYGVAEIHVADEKGIITASSGSSFVGFDFASGDQSAEFLCLLYGEAEYVQDYQPTTMDNGVYRKYAGVALENGGFLQVGYDGETVRQEINQQVRLAARNRHIGQDGYIIIFDEQGTIISDRNGHEGENIVPLFNVKTDNSEPFRCYLADVFGTDAYCMYTKTEGYYILAVLPESEAMFTRDVAVYILAFMEVLVFGSLFAFIFTLIKRLVVENVRKVNESLEQITRGNLDVVVDVRDNAEFASLSDGINSTVTTLRHYIDEAAARFDKDLEIAKTIQHSALPSVFPPYPNRKDFSIFASMDAAKEVGGDFYDFYLLDDKHLAFLIADVSGKGIPGAMFMMTSKAMLKSHAESGLAVNDVFTQVNSKLCENNEAGMFVTAWMGILDLETGLIKFANAGHNPPVVRRKDGRFEYLKGRVNLVLAGMEGVHYREQELQLEPGDTVYLYTDGVTEAHNPDKELFGEERLLESLNRTEGTGVEDICRMVKADVDVFAGEAEQFDDITMLCVRLHEKNER